MIRAHLWFVQHRCVALRHGDRRGVTALLLSAIDSEAGCRRAACNGGCPMSSAVVNTGWIALCAAITACGGGAAQDRQMTLKRAVAQRALEFGAHVHPNDVVLEHEVLPGIPQCTLFAARWGGGRRRQDLSGLACDGEAPDTYPGRATTKIFQRWLVAAGQLPNPEVVASTVSYIFDPTHMNKVLLGREDAATYSACSRWTPFVHAPRATDVAGAHGVSFWWTDGFRCTRFVAYVDSVGELQVTEDHGTADQK